MLETNLLINVVVGIAVYKGIIAIIEFTCLRLLAMFLGKQISGNTRKQKIDMALKLAEEELKRTELN